MRERKRETRNAKPSNSQEIGDDVTGPRFPVSGLLFSLLVLLICTHGLPSSARDNTAVVTGSARVHIRRGPGTEFPAFATLTRGTTLEVQEMSGEWARVVTAHGQVGYVNSTFLALPGETSVTEPQNPPPTPVALAQPAAPPESDGWRDLSERNSALAAEVRRLQDELAAVKNRPDSTPAPAPPASDSEKLQVELARLTSAVEGLQHRLDSGPANEVAVPLSSPPIDPTAHVVSPATVVLGISGLVVGWLMGSAYGRRKERTRRSRVRF